MITILEPASNSVLITLHKMAAVILHKIFHLYLLIHTVRKAARPAEFSKTMSCFHPGQGYTHKHTQSKLAMEVYECTWTFMGFHGKKHGFSWQSIECCILTTWKFIDFHVNQSLATNGNERFVWVVELPDLDNNMTQFKTKPRVLQLFVVCNALSQVAILS